jgi:hypothetical protein
MIVQLSGILLPLSHWLFHLLQPSGAANLGSPFYAMPFMPFRHHSPDLAFFRLGDLEKVKIDASQAG